MVVSLPNFEICYAIMRIGNKKNRIRIHKIIWKTLDEKNHKIKKK